MVSEFWNWRLDALLSSPKIESQYWKIVQVIAFKNDLPIECRGFDAGINCVRILSKFKDSISDKDKDILKLIIQGRLTTNWAKEKEKLEMDWAKEEEKLKIDDNKENKV
jgi:hypothetical protein